MEKKNIYIYTKYKTKYIIKCKEAIGVGISPHGDGGDQDLTLRTKGVASLCGRVTSQVATLG